MKFVYLAATISILVFLNGNNYAQTQKTAEPTLMVYYFHTTVRCKSCHNIEEYTKETLTQHYKDQLADKTIVFNPVNVDTKGNQHFMQDYGLYTKSVVLSLRKDGEEIKAKNLEKVWQYLNNKDKFIGYVKDQIDGMLGENK